VPPSPWLRHIRDSAVAVISKVYPMRSHTVSAEGGAAAATKAENSLDEHASDTISGGDWLSDQDAVEAFVREAPEEMLRLKHWACPWRRLHRSRERRVRQDFK
jgi:fumarate reductase flavoprotein subunit